MRLTAVGERLRDDLRPVYQGLRESLERARTAAQGKTDVLRTLHDAPLLSWCLVWRNDDDDDNDNDNDNEMIHAFARIVHGLGTRAL